MTALTRTVDRSTIILPIRWEYWLQILDGSKWWEFRTRPLPEQVVNVLAWPTGRRDGQLAGGVAGLVRFDSRVTASAASWTGPDGGMVAGCGIDRQALARYAGHINADVTGHHIEEVAGFPAIVPGQQLGTSRAPQAFAYAPTDWPARVPLEVFLAA